MREVGECGVRMVWARLKEFVIGLKYAKERVLSFDGLQTLEEISEPIKINNVRSLHDCPRELFPYSCFYDLILG